MKCSIGADRPRPLKHLPLLPWPSTRPGSHWPSSPVSAFPMDPQLLVALASSWLTGHPPWLQLPLRRPLDPWRPPVAAPPASSFAQAPANKEPINIVWLRSPAGRQTFNENPLDRHVSHFWPPPSNCIYPFISLITLELFLCNTLSNSNLKIPTFSR